MDDLLLKIAHCESMRQCLSDKNSAHPCQEIVESQLATSIERHQLPEPWAGEIKIAKILFISSNPSIGEITNGKPHEVYPTGSWGNEKIVEYFNGRFGSRGAEWIKNGIKPKKSDGSYGKYVRFWASVKARSKEILQRDVDPGTDYALTEVVHCKSKRETGVAKARDHCSDLYLKDIILNSAARIIVVLGKESKLSMIKLFPSLTTGESFEILQKLELLDKELLVIFSPHPNARVKKRLSYILTKNELQRVREFVVQ